MKKIVGILTLSIIFVVGIFSSSFAANSVDMKVKTNTTIAKQKDEVKVTLSAMSSATEEIQEIAGAIIFNDSVFEIVTMDIDEAIEESEGLIPTVLEEMKKQMSTEGVEWKLLSVKEDKITILIEQEGIYGFATILALAPLKTSTTYTDIGEITFKVKSSAKSATEKISFTNMQVDENLKLDDVSTQAITINAEGNGDFEDIPSLDPEDNDDTNNDIKAPTTENQVTQENQIANTDAPDTGIEDVIPFIVIALILGVVGYFKYCKYQGI